MFGVLARGLCQVGRLSYLWRGDCSCFVEYVLFSPSWQVSDLHYWFSINDRRGIYDSSRQLWADVDSRENSVTCLFLYIVNQYQFGFSSVEVNIVWRFFLILAIYYLFVTYREQESQRNIFNASLIIALGSLLWTYILWFIPLLWYGMYKFRSLNLRTFLSSLLGIVVVAWSLYNYSLWQHDYRLFSVFDSIFKLRPLSISGNVFIDWLTIGTTIGLTLLASANILTHEYEDNLRTREFLSFLIVLAFSSFALYFLYEQSSEEFLQIACFPASILISHFFTIVRNKYTFWLFHLSVLLLIVLLLLRLWNF